MNDCMDFPITNARIYEFLNIQRKQEVDNAVRTFKTESEFNHHTIYHRLMEQITAPDMEKRTNFRVLVGRRTLFHDSRNDIVESEIRKLYETLLGDHFPDATLYLVSDAVYISFVNPLFNP